MNVADFIRKKCRNGCIYLCAHIFILVSLYFGSVPESNSGSKLVDFIVEGCESVLQVFLFYAVLFNPLSVFFTLHALTVFVVYGVLNHKQKKGEDIEQYEKTVNDILAAVPMGGIILLCIIALTALLLSV